ncbi:Type I restriction-modification system, restriction subunit R [Enhygromyxa salina]|uniref:Type I restriction-modification system, restriction subunit R n=1 Tax=Enhygromyxa salina TaxID=215803 RepID=A0A0C1Z9P5_9BACT|nr:type I restriction endonuclease [Enhygromyxa salina]KIG14289.1 Type I restriction-modification system, restriction subunit R [Enhygromyxa salina]
MTKPTTEAALEQTIEEHLLTAAGGYLRGDPSTYDPLLALIPNELIDYVRTTQPKTYAALTQFHGDRLPAKLLEAFDKATVDTSLIHVLRRGFRFHGKQVKVVTFRPPNNLNPEVQARYAANRLLVVRQLHHDPKQPKDSLDLVLFVNGIPVVTAELKNHMTGQRVSHAKQQYRKDRDPDTQIFRFKRRAIINFAVDPDEVYMTAQLERDRTHFLPFNQGIGTAAGNPAVKGKHRTAYLWERVWQRDSLLDILARFVHLELDRKRERMIFPRYHQLDCVRQLEDNARDHGSGTNYLIQHSAGSGKSNSIAWLAHRLAALHDKDQRKVYDSVVVITDRKVLDQQLQNTIFQLDHTRGVVQKIDENSAQLAKALADGVPIIITTLHKFAFISEQVGKLPDRRYAIIVDEAHSSQTGDMRNNLKAILADSSELSERVAALGEEEDVDAGQDLLRAALARGPLRNLSFFAFTATPKYKTLQVFGRKGEDGRYQAFHVYSMRQAIDEKFILDVLRGYTTYRRYFKLIKTVAEDPRLDKKQATKALARFVSAHPKDVEAKLGVIVEHFHGQVRAKLGGRAKGMIVTSTRLQAVRFKLAFDVYVADKGYDLRALVAFSGEVSDPGDPASGQRPYTEPGMNTHYQTGEPISESALPKEFGKDGYQLLIVANKYQTGFDQPLLCAMYVDKRLAGVQAVQTLSRLNRTYRGKDETFVLDFVNEREHILACFKDYYERTTTAEDIDPQRLYELQTQLEQVDVIHAGDVDAFAELFFTPQVRQVAQNHGPLNSLLDLAVDRFKALDAEPAELFRDRARAFCRLYSFLGQVVPFSDYELEKLYVYTKMLIRKLPRPGEGQRPVDLGEDVALHYYRLEKIAEGDLSLVAGEGGPGLRGPSETGTGRAKAEQDDLSNLIERMNQRFTTAFDVQDLVDSVFTRLLDDPQLRQVAQANDEATFGLECDDRVDHTMMDRYDKYGAFLDELFVNEEMRGFFKAQMRAQLYAALTKPPA